MEPANLPPVVLPRAAWAELAALLAGLPDPHSARLRRRIRQALARRSGPVAIVLGPVDRNALLTAEARAAPRGAVRA